MQPTKRTWSDAGTQAAEMVVSPLAVLSGGNSNPKSVSSHLEEFFKIITEFMNTRQFARAAAMKGFASDFYSAMHEKTSEDLVDHFAHHKKIAMDFPQYHITILDMSSKVDLKRGAASLFSDLEITGRPPGVTIRSMTISEFKIIDGRWLCTKATGIRGNRSLGNGGIM